MPRKKPVYFIGLAAPADLRDALLKEAKEGDRSVSATVRVLLWEAIRARERPVDPEREDAAAEVP